MNKTPTVRTQRRCPDCGRLISLYADGTFYFHVVCPMGAECRGSHKEAE